MSETETWKGKIRRVACNDTKEDWAQKYMKDKGVDEKPSYFDSWIEFLEDHEYRRYCDTDHGLFEILAERKDSDEYILSMERSGDGEYDILMQFYNGGTCLSEMIQDGLNELNN